MGLSHIKMTNNIYCNAYPFKHFNHDIEIQTCYYFVYVDKHNLFA